MPEAQSKVDKEWTHVKVHARCTACPKDWQGEGNWPMGAAANHTRSTGHVTEVGSSTTVRYSRADD